MSDSSTLLTRSLAVVGVAFLLNFTTSLFLPKVQPLFSEVDNLGSVNVTTVKLYGFSMSTCTRRVATVLKEKEIPYELVPIDLSKGEQKNPNYISTLQPFGQVPVLQDGDLYLFESRAIAKYIATKFATRGTPLVPPISDLQAWAKFEQAVSIEQNNFDPFASGIAAEKVFKVRRGGTTDEKRVEDLTAGLKQKMDGYETILSKQKYLAGDEITLADLFHLPYGAMITEQLGVDALTSKPNVARWWKDITSRPSWLAVKDGA